LFVQEPVLVNVILDAKLNNWETVYDFLKKNLSHSGMMKIDVERFCVACEEIFTNICLYAYRGNEEGKVEVRLEIEQDTVKVHLIDEGIAFDPTQKTSRIEIEAGKNIDNRKIGGLGIHIAKKIVDFMEYERVEGRNMLFISKKLDK
jgi:anti-sigma regulatory factor (Ser/Thr protein kinase)